MRRFAASFALLCLILAPASTVHAQILNEVCKGPFPNNEVPSACQDNTIDQGGADNSITGPDGAISKATNIVTLIVGIAAFIVIIVSGLQFILGVGDPAKIANARNALIYALVGIVIAVMAQVIVKFVVNKL